MALLSRACSTKLSRWNISQPETQHILYRQAVVLKCCPFPPSTQTQTNMHTERHAQAAGQHHPAACMTRLARSGRQAGHADAHGMLDGFTINNTARRRLQACRAPTCHPQTTTYFLHGSTRHRAVKTPVCQTNKFPQFISSHAMGMHSTQHPQLLQGNTTLHRLRK